MPRLQLVIKLTTMGGRAFHLDFTVIFARSERIIIKDTRPKTNTTRGGRIHFITFYTTRPARVAAVRQVQDKWLAAPGAFNLAGIRTCAAGAAERAAVGSWVLYLKGRRAAFVHTAAPP